MEPQEQVYCYDNRKCSKKKNCLCIVTIILLAAFAVVIGLIIGAAISVSVYTDNFSMHRFKYF